jgi:feruloyl esterase
VRLTAASLVFASFSIAAVLYEAAPAVAVTSCESLASLALPYTTITAAQSVPAGTYTAADGSVWPNLPAFCQVAGSIMPTSDSNIHFGIWMPISAWNGKFKGNGNGGFAGSIEYSEMAPDLVRGYATSSTDTGSTADGSFALGHPEKIVDFGYRAHHELAMKGEAITQAFYGVSPKHSYFQGCSGGGAEAQMESQRFPNDYDGIIIGDPANYWTHHYVGAHLWILEALYYNSPNTDFPISADAILGNATNAACDALDGLVDGIITDPRDCHFHPATLLCKPGQNPSTCLNATEVGVVHKLYAGPKSVTYRGYYYGLEPGAEATNWPNLISSSTPYGGIHGSLGIPFFQYFVFDDPNWNFHTWQWTPANLHYVDDKQILPNETLSTALNAINPDLRPIQRRGAKLIHYHGFNDPDISPLNSIYYYISVLANQAGSYGLEPGSPAGRQALEQTQDFYRLFLVPGMSHCTGGAGPATFDSLTALEQWVEQGIAPDQIIATQYVNNDPTQGVQRTRPLCPYPQISKYNGTGDPNDAANFNCVNDKDDYNQDVANALQSIAANAAFAAADGSNSGHH